MRLVEQMPAGAGCLFLQRFRSVREVTDARGVIVASSVGAAGPGISPTGVSGRVTYGGTQDLLINSTQMTIRVRYRTGVTVPNGKALLSKLPISFLDNQFYWIMQIYGGFVCSSIYVCGPAANDVSNIAFASVPLIVSTEYVEHFVYNGSLAAGLRGQFYRGGLATTTVIAGTLPVSMRASASPVCVFQANGGTLNAPTNDFVLIDFALNSRALSPAEVLDDYNSNTYGKLVI